MGKYTCSGILESMPDYIDGTLTREVCAEIEDHLKTCDRCRFHVDSVKLTIMLYEGWRPEGIPRDAEIRLRERLMIIVREAAKLEPRKPRPRKPTRPRGGRSRNK